MFYIRVVIIYITYYIISFNILYFFSILYILKNNIYDNTKILYMIIQKFYIKNNISMNKIDIKNKK